MKKIVLIFECCFLLELFVTYNAEILCKSANMLETLILQDNLLASLSVSSQAQCEMKCRETSACFSVNYYEEQKKCHLNKATHLSRPLHLVYDMEGVYIKIKNDYCSDAYCSTGHVCLIADAKLDYSCQVCNSPLGLESGTIPNNRIVASSYYGTGHEPWRGRLRMQPKMPYGSGHVGCWQAKNKVAGEYLQVDLGNVYRVTMVATQGRPHAWNTWMTSYSLSYALNNGTFTDYKYGGSLKVFPGNSDRDTIVTNVLPESVRCRYIRIIAVSFSDAPALRAEIYGCLDD